jgi:type I restriction enzyme, S subunit
MKSNYKLIGKFVQQVNVRNKDLSVTNLQGISINKLFMPSVANTNGTDLSKYKVVSHELFAYNPMHVGRDEVLPISMLDDDEKVIVSPAYIVFKIIDKNELLPEYFMMWCRRPEFDRNAWFTTDSSIRGGFSWDDFCDMELPVPSIEKQREIVKEYNTIVNRIKLNEQLNQKLEETAQAIYKRWFVDFEFPVSAEYAVSIGKPELEGKPYKASGGEMVYNEELDYDVPKGWDLCSMNNLITVKDGTHDSPKPSDIGYPLITSTHLNTYSLSLSDAYNINDEDFHQVNKRSKVDQHDILISMIGTVGTVCYVLYDEINFAIKNVGLFKTSERLDLADYIFFWLKSYSTKQYVETCMLGSTQSYITLTDLRSIPILLPTSEIIHDFQRRSSVLILVIHDKVIERNLCSYLLEILQSKIASA